jgi:polysaccharide deacetylase family protein (PEP-CTERM system associated)
MSARPPAAAPAQRVKHFFSVDVEEHFQVSAFERVAPPSTWDAHPSRVARNTRVILELLAEAGAKGTFFTVGWVAERQPDLIREIARAGHELGSHTWWHRRVMTLSPDRFRDEVRRSKAVLEELTGTAVVGFRAPSFSIVPGTEWAFDVLLEEGYRYDSSVFPIRRPGYGYPGAPTAVYSIHRPAGTLTEVPMATGSFLGVRVPAAGGGYLRQFPLSVITGAFRRLEAAGTPGMFYVHPWEVDPDQPRLRVGFVTRVRHYRNLDRTVPRLRAMLKEFSWHAVRDAFPPAFS